MARDVLTFHRTTQIAADQSAVAIGCVVVPCNCRVTSVKSWLGTKTGTNAASLDVLYSVTANDTAANSTTSLLTAAMAMTSDAVKTGTLAITGGVYLKDQTALYIKVTTGGTTTMDLVSVTIEIEYDV